MAVVKNLMVRAGADFSGLSKGFKKAGEEMTAFKEMTRETFKIIGEVFAAAEIIKFLKETATAYNFSVEQETKLTTIMKQRMNANEAMVSSVINLTKEQQSLGVIQHNTQLAGAQQLATFLKTSDSLKTLIPAMNNLAAQQEGTNVTSEGMVNIGKAIGKVMDGNVGALKRLGISFTAADQVMMKYGTEQERAAALAKVINNNVGQMNAALLNTPEGRMKNLKNSFDDVKDTLGKTVIAMRNLFLPVLQSALNVALMLARGLQIAFTTAYQFIQAVFGKAASQTSDITKQASAVKGLGDAYTDAAAAAKGSVAGFDQVNTLASQSSAGSGSSPLDALADSTASSGIGEAMGEISKKVQAAADVVKRLFGEMKDAVKGLFGYIVDNKTVIIAALAGIAAGFTAWLLVANWADILWGIQLALKGVSVSMWLVNAAMAPWKGIGEALVAIGETIGAFLAAPEVLIALAVAAIVGAGVWLWLNWDKVSTALVKACKWIGSTFSDVWHAIEKVSKKVWNGLITFFTVDVPNGFNDFVDFFKELPGKIGKFLHQLFIVDIPYHIGYAIGYMIQYLTDELPKVVKFFEDLPGKIGKWFAKISSDFAKWTVQFVKDAGQLGSDVFDGIVGFFKKLPGEISTWLTAVGTKLSDFVADALTAAQSIGQNIYNGIVDFIKSIPGKIDELLGGIVEKIKGIASSIAGAIGSIFGNAQKGIDAGKAAATPTPTTPSVPSKSFSMPGIPIIPHASGGVFTKPTMLGNHLFGEAGAEAIVPLENSGFLDKMSSAIATAVMAAMKVSGGNNNNNSPDIILDGVVVGRVLRPHLAKEETRIGSSMIVTAGKSQIVTS